MTLIKAIKVKHIRAHADYGLDISPEVTLITGANGSGKTSLIEALFIALQGTSFKGLDMEVLMRDAAWYRIDVEFDDDTARTVKFDSAKSTGRKQFTIDGKTNYRLLPKFKYPVVLFEPDDLRLLSGSPTRRRQFIDHFITQLDARYGIALRRYERALKQRNTLLKRHVVNADSLFAWNVALSEYGAYIITERIRFIERLNERLNGAYTSISHTDDIVTVAYSERYMGDIGQKLLADLHSSLEKDQLLGFTSTGPHRHDLLFSFNNSPAMNVASRGEIRSVVLALKFLEVSIIEQLTDKKPIVLLDDVFSELDKDRQDYLIDSMKDNQIIITSATNNSQLTTSNVIEL